MRRAAHSTPGKAAGFVCLLLGLLLSPPSVLAQDDAGSAPAPDVATSSAIATSSNAAAGDVAQRSVVFRKTDSVEAPPRDSGRSIYRLPPMTVERDRWRLPEDIRQQLWADQQREIERLQQERERQRHDDALVAIETASGVVLKILPEYDPYEPRVIDMGIDESETEVITIFGGKF